MIGLRQLQAPRRGSSIVDSVDEAEVRRRHGLRPAAVAPELQLPVDTILRAEPAALPAVSALRDALVPLTHEPARETQRRNLLVRLRDRTETRPRQETLTRWFVHDESHHGYVRQYGLDFADRVAAAGFEGTFDRTLLEPTVEEHLAAGTYPMRVYVARRLAG